MAFVYRRFFILCLVIATFAGVTANIIQNTRTNRSGVQVWTPTQIKTQSCVEQKLCHSFILSNKSFG